MSGVASAALVAAGGAAGAVVRHLAVAAGSRLRGDLPWATLAVNVAGAFLLGLVVGAASGDPGESAVVLLVGVGLCGGLTTYSGVSMQAVELAAGRERAVAAGYAAGSLVLAVAAAALGHLLGAG